MVTIRQLAKELGLSPTTVSMVLNSAPLARNIPETTQKRVRQAAKRLGYSPNPFARYLRSSRSGTVAVLLSDITDPYCAEVLKGIDASLYSSNYVPVLLDIQNSRARFKGNLRKLIERRIEGIIGVANSVLLQTALLAAVKTHTLPIVLIGRETSDTGISSVSIENEASAWTAMKHLYDLGHRRIAFIQGPRDNPESALRWKGIRLFAKETGLIVDPALTVRLDHGGGHHEAGYKAAGELIRRRRPFTAILAFDDLTAFGAIRALARTGKRVPADCSVIGFDDIAAAALYNPPVTTMRQPMALLGAAAAEIFVEQANDYFAQRERTLVYRKIKTRLVVRESTAAAPPPHRGSSRS